MDSWWELGEWGGYPGEKLATYRIACAFCREKGNFKPVYEATKKKPDEEKTLHFDTLECGNCKGYVMVFWSSTGGFASQPHHDYRAIPYPMRFEKHPEHWPEAVGRFWLQAHRSLGDENWDAAAVMARSALQAALREQKAEGANLKQEIDDLATKGTLPPLMRDWSTHVRELGNDSAHPDPKAPPTAKEDARDVVKFLDFLVRYLYDLPHDIDQYRKRQAKP